MYTYSFILLLGLILFRIAHPERVSKPKIPGLFLVTFFTCLLFNQARAQISDPSLKKIVIALKASKPDTNRVNLLQELGSYYLFKPGEFKNDLDSAINNFKIALALSQKYNFKKGELKTMILIAKWSSQANDFTIAKPFYPKIVNYYHSIGDKLNEALIWKEMGDMIEYHDMPHLGERAIYFKHAYDLLKQIPGKETDAINAYKDIADVHLNQQKYQLAETEFLQVARHFEDIHYLQVYKTYYMLSEVYKRTQNFQKQLFYSIECVKGADSDTAINRDEKAFYYFELAQAYLALKDFDQSVIFGKKSFEIAKKVNFDGAYSIVALITGALLSEKKTGEALAFLQKQEKAHPPKNDYAKGLVARLTLQYNTLLKRYNEASIVIPYLLSTYSEQQVQKAERDSNYIFVEDYVRTLTLVAGYYLATHQNHNAAVIVNKLLPIQQQKIRVGLRMAIYSMQYKVDSIKGNYLASLQHYAKMAKINDSISNYATNEEIAKMYASFKTFQKEQAIKALNKKNTDQEINLQKASLRQKYMAGVGVLLLIITGLTFYGLRNKQRSNIKLKAQQQKINVQNDTLSMLVGEKNDLLDKQEKLLTEKDWLLKEVHHRVKNNLQIVMSLLSSQSAYLENTAALEAIRESQNRVQAISLIHQKLYSTANVANINMPAYVKDLVGYLTDCFDTSRRGIKIEQLVESFNLDLAQAVPLGLILNEAITNAIKYAFDKKGGEIIIAMQQIGKDGLILHISDNGKGLPDDFDLQKATSLGMEMMKALSKQLGGEFKVTNKYGLHLSVEFLIEHVFSHNLNVTV